MLLPKMRYLHSTSASNYTLITHNHSQFEIAQEETEKKTVYAADDRVAAKEELGKLKEAFNAAVNEAEDEDVGKEITRRVGQRVRELERAVEAMDELAMED